MDSGKYEVVGGNRPVVDQTIALDESDLYEAGELQKQYGLTMFSVADIARIWRAHSESSAAGWLMPSGPEEIEGVFGVTLQPVKEQED